MLPGKIEIYEYLLHEERNLGLGAKGSKPPFTIYPKHPNNLDDPLHHYLYPMEKQILIDLVTKTMPFGKYKGRLLCDIPEEYLIWLRGKGFPDGRLGMWLNTLYEIRLNGLEDILTELRKNYAKRY